MRTNTMLSSLIAGAALMAVSPFAQAQNPETKESLQKKLIAQYKLTKLTADRKGVITPGAVLTLKIGDAKDGLVMNPSTDAVVCVNQYKARRFTIGLLVRTLCEKRVPGVGVTTRKFVEGEKLNVTKIGVGDKSVVFELYSKDAYENVYYRVELSFPIEKGTLPSADELLATTGEVFSVAPPENIPTAPTAPQPSLVSAPPPEAAPVQAAVPPPPAQAATPDAQPVKYADIAPPPPPPVELKKDLTIDEVIAQLGQPVTTAKVSDVKQIYLFKDWKITFINGKVADIDVR